MKKKIVFSITALMIIFGMVLSACEGLGGDAALSTTQTAMVLQQTQAAMDKEATQNALNVEATKAESDRLATEAAKPTDTPLPTDTPTTTPTDTPTNTPEIVDTATPEATATETPTETPVRTYGPTATATQIKGQAKVRIENRTEYDLKLKLECIQGPCASKSPKTYSYNFPNGVWIIYVWDGKYKFKEFLQVYGIRFFENEKSISIYQISCVNVGSNSHSIARSFPKFLRTK